MNSTADLGGIFIVLDGTALAFAQIINLRQTGPWEGDRLDSDQFRGGFTRDGSRDTVQATSESIPRYLENKNYVKILVVNTQHELAYPPP